MDSCAHGFGGFSGFGSNNNSTHPPSASDPDVPVVLPPKQYTSDYLKYCRPIIVSILIISFLLLLYTIIKAIIGIITDYQSNNNNNNIQISPLVKVGGKRKMKIRKPRMKFKGGCSEDLNVCLANPT
jgi:hypothetical protein